MYPRKTKYVPDILQLVFLHNAMNISKEKKSKMVMEPFGPVGLEQHANWEKFILAEVIRHVCIGTGRANSY